MQEGGVSAQHRWKGQTDVKLPVLQADKLAAQDQQHSLPFAQRFTHVLSATVQFTEGFLFVYYAINVALV